MRVPLGLLAVATVALLTTPGHASTNAGEPCTANTTNLNDSHLGHRTGELHGGPWAVVDGDDVTVTCVFAVGAADCYTATGATRITSDPQPRVGLLPPVLFQYWNPYAQAVYLGTTITWSSGGVVESFDVDADQTKPGAQCAVIDWGNEG